MLVVKRIGITVFHDIQQDIKKWPSGPFGNLVNQPLSLMLVLAQSGHMLPHLVLTPPSTPTTLAVPVLSFGQVHQFLAIFVIFCQILALLSHALSHGSQSNQP